MFLPFQVVTAFLVSVAFGLALAHALELPGKLRLDEKTYLAVQTIYYPGFTIGGASEPIATVATLVLALVTSRTTVAFWLTLAAFVALLAMQVVFWFVTQPVNRYWLKTQQLKGLGAKFFAMDEQHRPTQAEDVGKNWTVMRDRWEYSHLLRAILSGVALIMLLIAIAF